MGRVLLEPREENPKLGLIVTRPALVQNWNGDFLRKLKKRCNKDLDFTGLDVI